MPLMFLVFGRLVGDFTGYFSPMPTTTKERFMHAVNQNALYMVYLGIARVILSYVSMLSIRTSGLRISARIRLAYLRALFLQPVSSMDMTSASPGVIATRLTTNSNIIELGISQQFSLAIQAITFTLGLYIVSFTKSGTLTLVASAPLPIVLIAYGFALPFIQKYYLQGEGIKEQASSLAFEIFESIRIVVAFGAEDRLTARHRRILQEARQYERKSAPFIGLLLAPMFIAVYATFALTFWFGIRQYTRGKIPGIQTIVVYEHPSDNTVDYPLI
jgi:ABC-type multidrug transport system fused ATPase/permease subunit